MGGIIGHAKRKEQEIIRSQGLKKRAKEEQDRERLKRLKFNQEFTKRAVELLSQSGTLAYIRQTFPRSTLHLVTKEQDYAKDSIAANVSEVEINDHGDIHNPRSPNFPTRLLEDQWDELVYQIMFGWEKSTEGAESYREFFVSIDTNFSMIICSTLGNRILNREQYLNESTLSSEVELAQRNPFVRETISATEAKRRIEDRSSDQGLP